MDNTLFTLLCGSLVLLMQLGFALLEAGMVEARIVVNVLFKNVLDMCVGVIVYLLVGYWIQSGFEFHPLTEGFAMLTGEDSQFFEHVHPYAHLFYQSAFAATAASICSGAVAGRMRLGSYLCLSTFITGGAYPFTAWWLWNKWGSDFHDLAGSVVVHSLGGAAAAAACLALGTRKKLLKDHFQNLDSTASSNDPIDVGLTTEMLPKAHSVPLTTAGMFLLFIGWFGFNMGSELKSLGTPEGLASVSLIALNTALAAAAGGLGAWILGTWFSFPSLTTTINGLLGGLVIVTANADIASPAMAITLGLLAAAAVVWFNLLLTRKDFIEARFDDPVGAVGVHLICGVLGGMAAMIFEHGHLLLQFAGSISPAIAVGLVVWSVLKLLMKHPGLVRVSPEDAMKGLDAALHQERAYCIFSDRPSLRAISSDLSELLGELKRNPTSFTFENGAKIHQEYSISGMVPFSAYLTRWIQRTVRISETFSLEYSGLETEPRPTVIETQVANLAIELANYCSKHGRAEKESHFNEAMTKMVDYLTNFRELVAFEADLESKGQATVHSLVEIKEKYESSGEYWRNWSDSIDKSVTSLKSDLEQIRKDFEGFKGGTAAKREEKIDALLAQLDSLGPDFHKAKQKD